MRPLLVSAANGALTLTPDALPGESTYVECIPGCAASVGWSPWHLGYGTFDGALDLRLERFTQFPDAAASARAQLEGKTVVSFCTGGIRCEKGAIHLREQGMDAYQLEGGILGCFEHVGTDHWTGECFVFEEREALTPDLAPRVDRSLPQ